MLFYILVFVVGLIVGYLIRWRMKRKYDGALVVTKTEDRTLYSLELFETFKDLDNQRSIIFKVVTPEESLDRD